MHCPEGCNYAANKAIRELEASGKIGRDEAVLTKVLEDTHIGFVLKSISDTSLITPGTTWVIRIDDNTYEGIARAAASHTESSPALDIGNLYLKSKDPADDTGEPFYVYVLPARSVVYSSETSSASLFELYHKTTTTTPIKPEYIPWDSMPGGGGSGGGLPVVELTSAISETSVNLTSEECAAIGEHAAKGEPIIIRAIINDATTAILCNYWASGNYGGYTALIMIGNAYYAFAMQARKPSTTASWTASIANI